MSAPPATTRPPVVVIGAGLAGLSAACHLRGAGHEVLVLEAGRGPGGVAGRIERDGYQFDTGPTVLTMPGLIEACFAAVGARMDRHLTLRPLDPAYRACFADGSEIRVRSGVEAMAAEIGAQASPADADGFRRFVAWLTELYGTEMPSFIDRNFDSVVDLLRPVGPGLTLLRTGAFRRLEPAVKRFFEDERLVRLFSFQALYAGLAPHEALAVFAVITYMDTVGGVSVAEGGMHALPVALARAAADAGVKIEYERPVERIVLQHGTHGPVTGVRTTDGTTIAATDVVCASDLLSAYRRFLPGMAAPRRARRGEYSPSALVWHLGVKGDLPEGAAHHNIHFGASWRHSFEQLMHEGRRMDDPSILVTSPTVSEPSMAPPGRHVLYVLEPVPNLTGSVDWSTARAPARQRLLTMLERFGYPTDIEHETLVDPRDWQAQGLSHGTPFSLSHRFFQTGPFRPANVERRAPGLVFAGAGTVPGVGVPMVLVSGRLAAERVAQRRDPSARRRRP